jgi:AraC-like DNA-binding protein
VILRLIQPSSELAPFIKTYWYLRNDSSKEVLQTIVPNGLMGLCFYRSGALDYAGLGKYQTGLGGQRMKSLIIQSCNVEAVGVEFQPYGLRRFFPMSSMDFYGLVCSPQDISDKELMILEEQILSAPDICQCWDLLNSYFLSRLMQVKADDLNFKRIRSALTAANGFQNISVEAMADNANLSPKQFRRIFSEYVGIMPKGYLRLVRHQRIMAYLLQACRLSTLLPSLDELSWSFGYYGASHLITDFKDIMGYNPSDLLKRHAPESYSWVDVEKTSLMNK